MEINQYQLACEMIRIGDDMRMRQQLGVPVEHFQVVHLREYCEVWDNVQQELSMEFLPKWPIALVGVIS